ncbi:protein YELLOW LEAF 1, choloroplastic-like [Phoenix dactylifera]|uniref:Protein YELLOW LEAF 1, choloroplastic-like n=1 Tax=Phoenix dactylifera TaxID=42345 RepID=A0A8B7CT97_PHODC|nr:protein YELLOW LEAF 1, choloroplastic-like [Phoenix dactylifera]
MMQSLSATIASPSVYLPTFTTSTKRFFGNKRLQHTPYGLQLPATQFHPFRQKQTISFTRRLPFRARICAAALNASCAAAQTQTVQRQSSTITVNPIKGKEKLPKLDDGGIGFPPRNDGGGGGGGGGGHEWSGGFYFFAFLVFLGYLKDLESKEPSGNRR